MHDMFLLDKSISVITGGFGQLGQKFSVTLAQAGSKVIILDQIDNPKKHDPVFSDLVTEKKIISYQVNITDKLQLLNVFNEIKNEIGIPSILINNAAIDSPPDAPFEENGPFENYPEKSLDDIINVNIKGAFFCCQVFGTAMAKQGKGSIINISSIYGNVSPVQDIYEYKRRDGKLWFKPAAYGLTKAALINLTQYLATYWAKNNVRVNAVSPAGIFNNQDQEFLIEYLKRIPIGRMADPSDLSGTILFLASEASTYITGINIKIDGGWTAW